MITFASLVLFFLSFSSLLTKLSLSQPTYFLNYALSILSPVLLGEERGREGVVEWSLGAY